MQPEIAEKIRMLKSKYDAQGLIILGVFGSFARGDAAVSSDIDILYECTDALFSRFKGWDFFAYYEDVKADFEAVLGRNVDLADMKALSATAQKHILDELIHVA